MNIRVFFFYIIMGIFLTILFLHIYGDDIPTHGKWDQKGYRSIATLPPHLSIDGNKLNISFVNSLENLNIQIKNDAGVILYEDVVSGNAGDVLEIHLTATVQTFYQVLLTHELGWLIGNFMIFD